MGGIFNGLGDLFTGGGGANLSTIPNGTRDAMLNNALGAQNAMIDTGSSLASIGRDQFQAQQNLLPFIYQQLGIRDNGQGGYDYIGTEAQNGMDQAARSGAASVGSQYINAGYNYDPTTGGISEHPDSQRNQFLDAQGRAVADGGNLRRQAVFDLLDPNGAGQRAVQGAQGQLDLIQGLQPAELERLGITRGPNGEYTNSGNTAYGQTAQALLGQRSLAEQFQMGSLGQMGYTQGPDGSLVWDPNSYQGQIQDYYKKLMGTAQDQIGTAQGNYSSAQRAAGIGEGNYQTAQSLINPALENFYSARGLLKPAQETQAAGLQRSGLMLDAQGNWVNDPNSYEMQARDLQKQYLDRAKMGMAGNVPINPGLQRQLAEEERQLSEQMIRQMGPGWETTSPGMEAKANFSRRRSELMYNEQQDAMNQGLGNAMGLQGSNLNTLASIYGSNTGVLNASQNATSAYNTVLGSSQGATQAYNALLQAGLNSTQALAAIQAAIGGATNTANSASTAQNQMNTSNAQIFGQNSANVVNAANAYNNMNFNSLSSLYGMSQPALAASQLLQELNLGNINAYGATANIGQDAIMNRARGSIDFQNSNANILAGIPQSMQNLYDTANRGRMTSLAALYPALGSAYETTGLQNAARAWSTLVGNPSATALGINNQIQNSQQVNDATNMNNMFWRSMAASSGSTIGSMGMGMGGAA